MKIKCDYCEKLVDESLKECPFCGASLSSANRTSSRQPKTIEELKEWYRQHKLPPEEITRFFIGKDIKEPKAFGIYRDDSGDLVVYKNKASGERAVRYKGKDEEYAVNELYQRLKSEIADQKANAAGRKSTVSRSSNASRSGKSGSRKRSLIDNPFFLLLLLIIGLLIYVHFDKKPARGYYRYNGNDYYYQDSTWYYYDPVSDGWDYASNSDELDSVIYDDTESDYRTSYHNGSSFEDTSWYDSGSSDDSSDWDTDSSWDYDDSSWDSGGSDWDSDW